MTYEALEQGLRARGFNGVEEMCNRGGCSKDGHYILVTDGCIIYSSLPDYHAVRLFPDEIDEWWDFDGMRNLFTWEKLDAVMNLVDASRKRV